MCRWGSRAALVLGALLCVNLWSAAARADCQPAVPGAGQTVTCSGSVPAGFASGVGQLTINVLAGALVGDNGAAGFSLGASNTVANFGSIVVGANRNGIVATGNGNVIVNHNTIVTGASGTAIDLGLSNFNTVTNNGAMTVGAGGTLISLATSNVVVNNGTMSSAGQGIVGDTGNQITNAGTISITGGGTAIQVGANNTIVNSGTLIIGCCGIGIFGTDGNTVTNSGTIQLGASAIAIQVGTTSTITNSGTISGADSATGIIAGDGNTIVNSGTISVGANGFGMQLQASNVVTNNGTILAGPGGAGIFVMANSTLTNNGTIRVGALGVGIFSPSTTNVVFTNNGTVDGGFFIGTCGCGGTNVVTNNGLMTITDAGTAVGLAGFTIGGSFSQSAPGTYAPRVAPGTNVNDFLAADVVNLNGTLNVVVTLGDYATTTSYRVVTATTSLAGQFAQVTTSAFFDIAATYNPLDVTVTLIRRGFANGRGATINQRHIGRALDAQYVAGLTGNASTIFNAVQGSTTTSVLDALSGEAAAAAQNGNFAVGGHFLALMLRQAGLARSGASGGGFAQAQDGQRVQLASADALADASPAQGRGRPAGALSMWMAGFGGHAARNGDAVVGAARQSIGFSGVALGADYRVSPSLLFGAALAASGSGYTVSDRAAEGDARNVHVGVYGGFSSGPLYVDGALSYAYGDFTNTRTIAVGAPEQANGAYSGHQFGGRLEAGWRMKASRYEIAPFGAVAVQSLRQSGYSERPRASSPRAHRASSG